MSQLTLMSLLQQQQSSALTGSLQPGLSLHSGYVQPTAMTSLTSASPGLLTSVTPGALGESVHGQYNIGGPVTTQGLVHSLHSSLGQGHNQQQAVVNNNNSLAYLTTTGGQMANGVRLN